MTPLDYHVLANSQDQDAELQDILKNGTALRLERVHITGTDVNLYCDTSTPKPRPFITTNFIRQVFNTLHGLSQRRQVGVPVVCVAGSGERLRRMDMRMYILPAIHCNAAREGLSREFQPPVGMFLSCAYRTGLAAACLVWLPVLSHCHRQIHQLAGGTPSV